MAIFRASPKDGVVWITGASSGIGYSLAKALCNENYKVIVTARRADKLRELEVWSETSSGVIIAMEGDVTNTDKIRELVAQINQDHGAIALAILNAGIYLPLDGDNLQIEDFNKTFAVNLTGVVNCLLPVVDLMKAQGRGQIAFVSSVAGYGGLPTSAAYGASKAALINMAESLKYDFDKMNIGLQLMNPGFVETQATSQNSFTMPAIVNAKTAAQRISDGLKSQKFEITFPRRFTYFLKFINLLPYWLYFPLVGCTRR